MGEGVGEKCQTAMSNNVLGTMDDDSLISREAHSPYSHHKLVLQTLKHMQAIHFHVGKPTIELNNNKVQPSKTHQDLYNRLIQYEGLVKHWKNMKQ